MTSFATFVTKNSDDLCTAGLNIRTLIINSGNVPWACLGTDRRPHLTPHVNYTLSRHNVSSLEMGRSGPK